MYTQNETASSSRVAVYRLSQPRRGAEQSDRDRERPPEAPHTQVPDFEVFEVFLFERSRLRAAIGIVGFLYFPKSLVAKRLCNGSKRSCPL